MTRGFMLYQTWVHWLKEIPSLSDPVNSLIARAIIATDGKLEEVEFITDVEKSKIFTVYQMIEEKGLLQKVVSGEKENKDHDEMEMDSMEKYKKRPERTFTRGEMVNYLKRKLIEKNPNIKFIGLKHNVLSCENNGHHFKVYISTSRDYEPMRKDTDYIPYRVSAWNKGNEETFSSYDYYAMLVKVDKNTKYVTDSDEGIEGLFLSKKELSCWLDNKTKEASGMINCYVRYIQGEEKGRDAIVVIDEREEIEINLTYDYQRGYLISKNR
ncbi:hypothetical protein [Lysinibacillus xylanilyticus]|nr:hypothetical protein [Lysinibacillus xylanilyticus]